MNLAASVRRPSLLRSRLAAVRGLWRVRAVGASVGRSVLAARSRAACGASCAPSRWQQAQPRAVPLPMVAAVSTGHDAQPPLISSEGCGILSAFSKEFLSALSLESTWPVAELSDLVLKTLPSFVTVRSCFLSHASFIGLSVGRSVRAVRSSTVCGAVCVPSVGFGHDRQPRAVRLDRNKRNRSRLAAACGLWRVRSVGLSVGRSVLAVRSCAVCGVSCAPSVSMVAPSR